MHGQRKARLEITPGEPQFVVRYVGKTEVSAALGKGCTRSAVQRIWDNYYDERGMDRVSLLINSAGIFLKDVERKPAVRRSFRIKDIAYCCAESGIHDRVFAWICRDPDSGRLECHAVLCTSPERAQLMAVMLHRAFHVAYKDWKRDRQRRARAKANAAMRHNGMTAGEDRTKANRCTPADGASDDSDKASEGSNECLLMESIMAQMNIVEEEEISLTDNNISEPN